MTLVPLSRQQLVPAICAGQPCECLWKHKAVQGCGVRQCSCRARRMQLLNTAQAPVGRQAIWLLTLAIAVHCSIGQAVSLLHQKLPPPSNGACIPLARTEK